MKIIFQSWIKLTILIISINWIVLTLPTILFSQISVHISNDYELGVEEAEILVSGDLYLDGDISLQSSRLVFNGTDNQYIYQASPKRLAYLTVDKSSGELTLTNMLQISDSLLLLQGKISTADTSVLQLLSSAASNAGDSASFVDGPLAKVYAVSASPDSFVFPVGDGQDFRPMTIYFASVSSDSIIVTSEQINQSAEALSVNYDNIDHVSKIRYWHISQGGNGAFSDARITFSYDTLFIDDGVELGTELRVAHLDTATAWIWNTAGGQGSDDLKGTIRSNPISDFGSGYFTFGDAAGGGDISLPVLLSLFELSEDRDNVILSWKTESEINNQFWLIQRKENVLADSIQNDPEGLESQAKFEAIAKLDGQGTKSSETTYAFIDNQTSAGKKYSYRLADVSVNGRQHFHDEYSILLGLPTKYELFQNYPNPFNPYTNIEYDLPVKSDVKINIYNMLGQKTAVLINEQQNAGYYKLKWNSKNQNGINLASGMYILAIKASGVKDGKKENFYKVKKMLLVK
jgi:hypothetical protein